MNLEWVEFDNQCPCIYEGVQETQGERDGVTKELRDVTYMGPFPTIQVICIGTNMYQYKKIAAEEKTLAFSALG